MANDNILNPKQQRIHEWIKKELQLSNYADVFEGAVILINQKPPGYISLVAHAGRDIMNGLARTFRGDKRQQVQYKNCLDDIEPMWKDKWGAQSGFSDNEEPSHHEIPHNLCIKLKSLIDDHRKGRIRDKETDELFFSTFLDYRDKENIPQNFLKEWRDTKKWFLDYTHIPNKNFSTELKTEITKHFHRLESFLDIAAGGQYMRIRDFDEILAKTNG